MSDVEKKTSSSTPFNKKNSKNILRVKKLHGWVLIRWVRTWREDGHQVRLVRLVSWDGRLASLQSRGTSRNLRQILKIGAVNLWVFKSCFWLEDIFYVSVVVMCICMYIYIYIYIWYDMFIKCCKLYSHIIIPFQPKQPSNLPNLSFFRDWSSPSLKSHIQGKLSSSRTHLCMLCMWKRPSFVAQSNLWLPPQKKWI